MRVAGIARVSEERQAGEDHHSLPVQVAILTEYVARKGWELAKVFEIPGESAYRDRLSERPQFQQAVDAAIRGEFDVLVVLDISRFARNQEVLHSTLGDLRRKSVQVWVAMGDFCATSDRFLAGIHGAVAEQHSELQGAKIRFAYQRRHDLGLPTGDVPFGYQRGANPATDPPTIVDAEAPYVRRAFEMYAAGHGYQAIATMLNAAGLRPRSKRGISAFSVSGVQSLIENDFYAGWVRHGESRRRGAHEAIISDDLYEAANSRVRRQGPRGSQRRVPLLSGLAVCATCGGPVWSTARGWRKLDGSRNHYYFEPSRRRGRHCADADVLWATAAAEREVTETLLGMRLEGEWFERAAKLARRGPWVSAGKERAKIEAERRRVARVFADVPDAMSEAEYEARMAALTARLAALGPVEPAGVLLAGERFAELADAWQHADERERNEVCRIILSGVGMAMREKQIWVRPRPEFRAYFESRAAFCCGDPKVLSTPDRTGTSLLPSGLWIHAADLRLAA